MKDSWESIKIGDEINLLGGFPFSSSKFNEEGVGVPLIRIRDLLKSTQETYFSGTYSDSYLVEKGEILIGMDGDFHLVKWNNSPSLLNQRILKVSGKKNSKLDVDFLFYYLKPFLIDVHNKTAATTVKHLSTYDISEAVEEFPPLPQQRKIAQILSTVDAVLEKTEAAIAKYQQLKQGLMHDVFTRGIDVHTGQLRPKQTEAPELYKLSALGWIPKEWEVEEFEIYSNLLINGGTPSTKNKGYWLGKIPWISGADFSEDFKIKNVRRKITKEAISNSSTNVIPKGELLLVTRTGVGKLAIAPFDIAISQDITGLIVNKEKSNVEFLYYYLQLLVEDFKKLNQGTSINGITRSDLLNREVILPNKEEQTLIAQKLQSIDQKIHTEQQALAKYQQLKAGLLQDLLTGRVEVNV